MQIFAAEVVSAACVNCASVQEQLRTVRGEALRKAMHCTLPPDTQPQLHTYLAELQSLCTLVFCPCICLLPIAIATLRCDWVTVTHCRMPQTEAVLHAVRQQQYESDMRIQQQRCLHPLPQHSAHTRTTFCCARCCFPWNIAVHCECADYHITATCTSHRVACLAVTSCIHLISLLRQHRARPVDGCPTRQVRCQHA